MENMLLFRTLLLRGHTNTKFTTVRAAVGEWFGGEDVVLLVAAVEHQARLKEWALAIQECRSSGMSVRQWCRERGTTATTYYRWEREVLSAAAPRLPEAAPEENDLLPD